MRRAGWLASAAVLLLTVAPATVSAAAPPSCHGETATIWGGSGPDVLEGTGGRDVIAGLGGDDVIRGKGGGDLICGGAGDDELIGGRGRDVLDGGSGRDTISGGIGPDVLWGGGGRDHLIGGPGDDSLRGFGGRDVIKAGGGGDVLHGGAGKDRMRGGGGDDYLAGGGQRDRLRGGSGSDVIAGGPGTDTGWGGKGSDWCSDAESQSGCETTDPGLWDWLRSGPGETLADALQDVVVLASGCDSPLGPDRVAVMASTFPSPAGDALVAAAFDLQRSAEACNRDDGRWTAALRQALRHLEEFNAAVAGGPEYPVEGFGGPAGIAPVAADVLEATRGYLIGGIPPEAESDFWWGLVHGGQARRLVSAGGDRGFDILLVGSSTMVNGGIPELLTDLDGRTVFNAGLPASGPEVQAEWVLGFAEPAADPDLVVIGVEARAFRPFDYAAGSCAHPSTDWFDAAAMRKAAFRPVDALAGSSVAARFFGDPPAAEPTRPLAAFDFYDDRMGPLGNRDKFPPSQTDAQKMASRTPILSWTVGYSPCEERIDILAGLVEDLGERGVDTIVVGMPLSEIRAGAFDPTGGLDPAAGRAVVSGLFGTVGDAVAAAGGTFVDLSSSPLLPEARFRDISHLDAEGAAIFTTLLAGAIES